MQLSGIRHALYFAVCKDDDRIYIEIVPYDRTIGKNMLDRAEDVIFTASPPQRPYNSPAFYRCKLCDARDVCWHTDYPRTPMPHCRNCCFSTPKKDGTWNCDKNGNIENEYCNLYLTIPPIISDNFVFDGTKVIHNQNEIEFIQDLIPF
jgi:hypothetical protein